MMTSTDIIDAIFVEFATCTFLGIAGLIGISLGDKAWKASLIGPWQEWLMNPYTR